MGRERYLVRSFGDNIEGTKAGVGKTLELLLGKYNSAVIVVPQIGQVKHTMLKDVLGEELSKVLIRDRVIKLEGGKTLSICASTTLRSHTNNEVYLALWGTEKIISDIEAIIACKAVVLVTWLPKDAAAWSNSYSPKVIFDDKKS
ncbi:TPA: hypothetical protein ACMD08_004487 [Vibrio parahaemolyticus]|uniref:hypothetical protein n=2 Tax=Vibrio parahaemolyticus TaxID=670 RepID=UPI00111E14E8|nr:hypothetical protein [Vibrio parahaemolyticus]EHR5764840.1 hypothetical protein [Vibrio parahaemolyticus]EHY0932770.1 hypothetical protein [Vibrio parahaemolyticus]EJC6832049.1 hypothetical protein [Vibrio parahaemolyticus]ELA9596015.1 hypothetical protein [Vibrio parahaemolyticus]MDF4381628.1 hypothetical protein [Vibrio parahaemolyticus]